MKALGFKDADGRESVPHGLRAAFKTWSQDHTDVDPALAERALGHAVRGDVQKAYDRATMVEKRRRLMAVWADYLTGAGKAQVVQLAEPVWADYLTGAGKAQVVQLAERRG